MARVKITNKDGSSSDLEGNNHLARVMHAAIKKRRSAISNLDHFQHYADNLFGSTGAEIGIACVKSKGRIVAKAEGDYAGDIEQVGDVLRMKITCDNAVQIKNVRSILWRQQELANARGATPEGMKPCDTPLVEKVGDYFAEPINHGYRAMNVKIVMPPDQQGKPGLRAEIQIVHRGLEDVNDLTHKPYEAMQHLTRDVNQYQGGQFTTEQARRYGKLVSTLGRIYDRASAEHGLDELLSDKGRKKIEKRQQWMAHFAETHKVATPEENLPPWDQEKIQKKNQPSLAERLVKLGFEIEKSGDNTPPPVADEFAVLSQKARQHFDTLPADEQAKIRGLLRTTPQGDKIQASSTPAPATKP